MPLQLGPRAVLAALTALNVVNYLDRFVAAAVLPLVITGLALTDTQAGSIQTVLLVAFTLASPAAGWLGSSLPRFRIVAVAIVIFSAATFASGLAGGFTALLIARAFVGIGEATYTVVAPTLVSDYFEPRKRGRAMAVFYAAMPVGSALGFQVGGLVGTHYGWQPAFFIAGAPGILLAALFFMLRDPVRGGLDATRATGTVRRGVRATVVALCRRPAFVVNTAAQTIYSFVIGGLAFWMPTFYVRSKGLSGGQAAFVFGAVLVVAGFAGTTVGGWVGDRLQARNKGAHFTFSGLALVASLPFAAASVLASSPVVYWSSLFVTLFLLFLNTGPLNAAMVNALPAALRERAYGVNTFCLHALGDAISPTLIGWSSDRVGLQLPVLVTALLLPVSGLVLVLGRKTLIRDLDSLELVEPQRG